MRIPLVRGGPRAPLRTATGLGSPQDPNICSADPRASVRLGGEVCRCRSVRWGGLPAARPGLQRCAEPAARGDARVRASSSMLRAQPVWVTRGASVQATAPGR